MAGFPVTVPGVTVQRACGSAQQAVHFAANLIAPGVFDVGIAAGVESMSRTAGAADDPKYGRRYPEALQQRFSLPTMGIAAERIAHRWNLSREYLDELSLRSHQLADRAWQAGRFDSQLHPIAQPDGTVFRTDEGVRPAGDNKLALKPAFRTAAGHRQLEPDLHDGAAITGAPKAASTGCGRAPSTQAVVGGPNHAHGPSGHRRVLARGARAP
jgi:acetyl-CoA acetyltransferase